MIIATIVNVLLMFVIFILVFVLAGLIFNLDGNLGVVVLGVSFVAAIGGSIFIYSKLVNWAVAKFNLEDKLVPLFNRRRGPKK
jgi:hypothetical protein